MDEIINEAIHTDFNKEIVTSRKNNNILILISIIVTFTVYNDHCVSCSLGWGSLPGWTLSWGVSFFPTSFFFTGIFPTTLTSLLFTTLTSLLPWRHRSHYLGWEPGWWPHSLHHLNYQACIRPPIEGCQQSCPQSHALAKGDDVTPDEGQPEGWLTRHTKNRKQSSL